MTDRSQNEIHEKGFKIGNIGANASSLEFSKIRVGAKTIDDAVMHLGAFTAAKMGSNIPSKDEVVRALQAQDCAALRKYSNIFFEISGIYQRLCKYLSFLYKYDWFIVPYIIEEKIKSNKVLTDLNNILYYLDDSNIKKLCGEIALEVIKSGCYYGYLLDDPDGISIQPLPANYCRTRFNQRNKTAVEFNMKFFDDTFRDVQYRMKVLQMFPKDFQKGYVLFKEDKLKGEYAGSQSGWYLLDIDKTVKFNLNGSDAPVLADVIPALIDLDQAQDLDRKKMMQQLLKIIIQKLPTDKNGDLIFDVDEATDLHNNAVAMLQRAVGVDVLTTFAEIDVADMADKRPSTSNDDLRRVERQIYNQAAISNMLFNTDGNIALEKSVINDAASIRDLVLQFQNFFNNVIQEQFKSANNRKKYHFRFFMLETTIHNYLEIARIYREQVQLGYSKMLPQIALGNSQSMIMATLSFENNILKLGEMMIPPLMSSTMSGRDILGANEKSTSSSSQDSIGEGTAGRPEKPDEQKSEKTIQNQESQ